MNITLKLSGLLLLGLSTVILATVSAESFTSKYKGEEQRAIKSLSKEDIAQLQKGAGWGLAKAAELNGYPGPIHVLEMASEISLTEAQSKEITALYKKMNAEAVVLGKQLVEQEKALNTAFQDRKIDNESLDKLVQNIGSIRSKLRFVHLAAHLETPKILSEEQITLYNRLRGYSANDPCSHVPKGHNEKMWKMHNGCN